MVKGIEDKIQDAVKTAQQEVSIGLNKAQDVASDITDKTSGAIKKYPVRAVLLVAVGVAVVGFIVGVVTSRRD